MTDLIGCGNHGCRIAPPEGMGTNGRCRCFDGLPTQKRLMAEKKIFLQKKRIAELEAKEDRMEEALIKIQQWTEAYPLDIFPEPNDWGKVAAQLYKLSSPNRLDNVSASNMRRVIDGVKKLVKEGLEQDNSWKPNEEHLGWMD